MKTFTHSKKALVLCMLSIVLCTAMLAGTTLAWFTDGAQTGANRITAGNLDIALQYSTDGVNYVDATDATDIFAATDLWEPGFTKVVYFKVINQGNLAVEYKVGTNIVKNVLGKNRAGEAIDLTNYIQFGIVETATPFAATDAGRAQAREAIQTPVNFSAIWTDEHNMIAQGDETVFAMVAWMPETVGNEANHNGVDVPSIEFGVHVIATQYAAESDSMNNQYDANAEYSKVNEYQASGYQVVTVQNQTEFVNALNTATATEPIAILLSGDVDTYAYPSANMRNKNIAFVSTDGATFDMTTVGVNYTQNLTGATFTFDGVHVAFPANSWMGGGYSGFGNLAKLTYQNCTISGAQYLYAQTAEFINCTFENNADSYSVCTYAAKEVTFTDCTFNTAGKAVLLYCDAAITTDVTLTNCVFNSDDSVATGKAAVETGDDGSRSSVFNITFTNCTSNGFDANNSTSPLWGNKVTSNMPTDRLNVVIDNDDVY